MIDFSQRVRELAVETGAMPAGTLVRASQYEFTYGKAATQAVSLLMPVTDRTFSDGALFAVMDMNLPEGFLLAQIRDRSPKVVPSKMHLLALMGTHGIGRVGYRRETAPPAPAAAVDRKRLIRDGTGKGGRSFRQLVDAYLSTGSGLSGVQPKILVPERASIATPNLLVKAAGADYPGLAANEFLCLEVARRAGLEVVHHALSDDGNLLLIDRFDLGPRGLRLGFEDIAALLDLRVGGALSDRKYRGSYEDIALLLGEFLSDLGAGLSRLFDAVALTVLVRNGDGHLKNFGLLYDEGTRRLAPIFDVVTTTLYAYERANGVRVTDRTMALKLRSGRDERGREYPPPAELLKFGQEVCRVRAPRKRIDAILEAMADVLRHARTDDRIPRRTFNALEREWEASMGGW